VSKALRVAGILAGFVGAGLVVFGLKSEDYPEPVLFVVGFLLIGVGFLSYKSQ
jgi:hypothetical protein